MATIHTQANLACHSGSKDAVYHLQIVEVPGGFLVNYQNGRRGGTLASGSKTPNPVALEAAQKIFNSVVKQKLTASPPYIQDGAPAPRFTEVSATVAARATGLGVQLLADMSDTADIFGLIKNPNVVVQQKFDGERRLLARRKSGDRLVGSNRKGLEVQVPAEIEEALGNFVGVLDGEIIGAQFYAFDLLEVNGMSLRRDCYLERKVNLNGWARHFGPAVQVVQDALTATDKKMMIDLVRALGQEGVVFRALDDTWSEGLPARGHIRFKLKNWLDATVEVLSVATDKRSVGIGVRNQQPIIKSELVGIGNVGIPTTVEMPKVGDLIDVKYLYAFEGGSLFQPTFKRFRTDLEPAAADLGQLQYKAKHQTAMVAGAGWDAAYPYVVVANPGQDDEAVVGNFLDVQKAYAAKRKVPGGDVMRRLANGDLTTEV